MSCDCSNFSGVRVRPQFEIPITAPRSRLIAERSRCCTLIRSQDQGGSCSDVIPRFSGKEITHLQSLPFPRPKVRNGPSNAVFAEMIAGHVSHPVFFFLVGDFIGNGGCMLRSRL